MMRVYLAGCDQRAAVPAVVVALAELGAVPVLPSHQAVTAGVPDRSALDACHAVLRVTDRSELADAEALAAKVAGIPVYGSLRAYRAAWGPVEAESVH